MFRNEYKEYNKFLLFSRIILDVERALKNTSLSKEEAQLLNELKDKLRAFEHIQKSWLKGSGILADYFKCNDLIHPLREEDARFQIINQKKLNQETRRTIKSQAMYAKKMTESLLDYIEMKTHPFQSLLNPSLLQKLKECAKNVLENATIIYEKISKINLYRPKSIYRFANLLEGRYIFSQQHLDPISGGGEKGLCYGHVMSWRNEIIKTGKCLSLPRADKDTLKHQIQQKNSIIFGLQCKSITGIWEMIDTFIDKLNADSIYELDFYIGKSAHAMGLRKLLTGEIEFFDPNYGLFVFPNQQTFRMWINELLADYLGTAKEGIFLTLAKIGKQPNGSVSSIPDFRKPTRLKNNDAWMIHTYNYKYNEAKLAISDFKLLMHIKNKNARVKFTYNNYAVLHKMTTEIDHVIKKITKEAGAKRKIMALNELKARLNLAAEDQTMISVLEAWLSDKPKNCCETYEAIIKANQISMMPDDLLLLVRKLSHHEINKKCMIALQTDILVSILDIIKIKKRVNVGDLPYFAQSIEHLFLKQEIDTQRLILLIQKKCLTKDTGFFAKCIHKGDADMLVFYKMMKDLDSDYPNSLIKTAKMLKKLVGQMEKDYFKKSELFNTLPTSEKILLPCLR